MIENIIKIITELTPAISIILVGVLTWFSDRRDKKNKKIQKLESKARILELNAQKELFINEKNKMNTRIEAVEQSQQVIIDTVNEINETLQKVVLVTLEDRDIIVKLDNNISNNQNNIKEVGNRLGNIEHTIDRLIDDVQNVSSNLHNSIVYSQSLANVVTTLAEGLRDNHMNGNISSSVDSFRETEREVFRSISETTLLSQQMTKPIKYCSDSDIIRKRKISRY